MRVNQLAKELCVMRSPAALRDDQWTTTVFHMCVRAGLTRQEARDILTFLQSSNSSPPATGLMTPVSLSPPVWHARFYAERRPPVETR